MGDRCAVSLQCLASDSDKFIELGFEYDEWESEQGPYYPQVITMNADEMNYAAYDPLHKLAASGVMFQGNHSEGGEYPGGLFAAIGGDIRWTDAWQGEPFVRVGPDGAVDAHALAYVREYYAMAAQVDQAFAHEEV